MDRATETAIKAIVIGLHRSKALNAHQIDIILAELAFAATNLAPSDADAAAEIEALSIWLRDATKKKDGGRKSLLSRF